MRYLIGYIMFFTREICDMSDMIDMRLPYTQNIIVINRKFNWINRYINKTLRSNNRSDCIEVKAM